MSPKNSIINQKLRFPLLLGSLFLGAYVLFANRNRLMGDLEAQRNILFVEDKEGRILLEKAIDAHKSL